MPNEGQHPGVADERGPQRAKGVASVATLHHEAERDRRVEQPLGAGPRQVRVLGDLVQRTRAAGEVLEQVEFDAGE